MKFVKFMTIGMRRSIRIMLGLLIIGLRLFIIHRTPGWTLPIVAVISISGGVFDFCLIGIAMGYSLKVVEARKQLVGM